MIPAEVPQQLIDEMVDTFPKFVVDNDIAYDYSTLVKHGDHDHPFFRPNYIVSLIMIGQLIHAHLYTVHNIKLIPGEPEVDNNWVKDIHDKVFSDPNVIEHFHKHHLMNGGTL